MQETGYDFRQHELRGDKRMKWLNCSSIKLEGVLNQGASLHQFA